MTLSCGQTTLGTSKHFQQVYDRLQQHRLNLKLKKCSLYQKRTYYLEFIISYKGIQPDPEKELSMQSITSTYICLGCSLILGLTGYYRRFIPQYMCCGFEKLIIYVLYHFLYTPTRTNITYYTCVDASQSAIGVCLT